MSYAEKFFKGSLLKKNNAGDFSPVVEDRAPEGSDLSATAGPPTGERSSAFFIPEYPPKGGSKAINPANLLGSMPNEFDQCIGQACSLDSHLPEDSDSPLYLETCKQVGIQDQDRGFSEFLFSIPDPDPIPVFDPNKLREKHDIDPNWERIRDENRKKKEELADVLAKIPGRYDESMRVRSCGDNFIAFKADCCGDTVAMPKTCGHRLCPSCMQRVSAKLSKKVEALIKMMKQPKHWTFTFVNVEHIDADYFSKIDKCFKNLRHRKLFKDSDVKGGFIRIETTNNDEDKTWHVHIHTVLDVRNLDIDKLIEAWKEITEKVTGQQAFEIRYSIIDKSGKLSGKDVKTVEQAVYEISKYVVKPTAFLGDPKLVDEYLKAVDGLRLISTFGNCYQGVIFRVSLSCGADLDAGTIPPEILAGFRAKGIRILPYARVWVREYGSEWLILNGREKYVVSDNENQDETKRKLNITPKLFDDDDYELPECYCGKKQWVRQGFVTFDKVFRDVRGYYRLRSIVSDA